MAKKETLIIIAKMLSTIVLVFMIVMQAHAAVVNYTLSTNDTYVDGNIAAEGDVHRYKITLSSAGTLTISCQGHDIRYTHFTLQNEELEDDFTFIEESVWDSSEETPKTNTQSRVLEKGIYYLSVKGYYNDSKGRYRVKAAFKPAGNNETEPNNTFQQAMELPANKTITGLISDRKQDNFDFYKIQVPSGQKITISYQGRIDYSTYSVWDKDYNLIKEETVWGASEESPVSNTFEDTLSAGIYYIKVVPYYDSGTGRYTISWTGSNITAAPTASAAASTTAAAAVTAPKKTEKTDKIVKGNGSGKVVFVDFLGCKIVKGKKKTLTTKILPADASNKKVIWKSGNTKVATVSSNGVVTAKSPGRVLITATAADGGGASTTRTFYVRPAKMKKPSVISSKKNRIRVKWKKVSGVSGYQVAVSKTKSFDKKTMKNMKQSKTSYAFKSLKSGKLYYIKMRAIYAINSKKILYGPWSNTVKKICK